MKSSFEYPDGFYCRASGVLKKHPEIHHSWIHNEKKKRRELLIPKVEETGFDVGVNCETYGLYPWAADWQGDPWDVADSDPVEKRYDQVLALLRILLSSESRLKYIFRGGKKSEVNVEFATPTGWCVYLRNGGEPFSWFGEPKETIYQNCHLPRRANFNGEDPSWYEHFRWTD